MSLGSRIKERREELQISRYELATKTGVTLSAISNYENGVSSPRTDTLIKLCSILVCDTNYLYQDDIISCDPHDVTPSEMVLIQKYRTLDSYGRDISELVLEKECSRVSDMRSRLEHYASLFKASHEHSEFPNNNGGENKDSTPWQN